MAIYSRAPFHDHKTSMCDVQRLQYAIRSKFTFPGQDDVFSEMTGLR